MTRNLLGFTGLFCLLCFSCKSYTSENFPDTQLLFGNGGGFTGMTTEYMLLENGQLFSRTGRAGSGEWKDLGKIEKAKAKELYKTWETNEIFKKNVQKPGNMYYFITMKKGNQEFRQSWGANDYQPDESLKSFFNHAMELVKSSDTDRR